jgi:hypothetical protein
VTLAGQSAPVTVTTNVSGITSTGTMTTPVLQLFPEITNVNRSITGYGLALTHATNDLVAAEPFLAGLGNGIETFSPSVSTSRGITLFGSALVGASIGSGLATNWVMGAEYLHYEFPPVPHWGQRLS